LYYSYESLLYLNVIKVSRTFYIEHNQQYLSRQKRYDLFVIVPQNHVFARELMISSLLPILFEMRTILDDEKRFITENVALRRDLTHELQNIGSFIEQKKGTIYKTIVCR